MTMLLVLLVIVPALVGFSLERHGSHHRKSAASKFRPGSPLVYQKQEVSTHPGADARDVRPSARGEFYYYQVLVYLRVIDILNDGRLIALAPNNRRLAFDPNDTDLRKAGLLERLFYCPRLRHS